MPTPSNHFDLIRLLLASAVMASHGFELIDGNRSREPLAAWLGGRTLGEIAVIAFFVLSGHLIQSSWMRDPSASRFLQRRLARIAPGFVVCSLICAICVAPFATDAATYWRQFRWTPYLASLINLHGPLVPAVFVGTHHADLNGSMWTIRLEFRCYLWLLLMGYLFGRREAWAWLCCAGVFGLASVFPEALQQATFRGDYWTTAPLAQMVPLLYAFSVGALSTCVPARFLRRPELILVLPVWLALYLLWPPAADALLPIAIAALLMGFGHLPSAAMQTLHPRWDLSYGVYLYAWPIQKLLLAAQPELTPWALFALAWPLTLLAALVSWHAVERPSLALMRGWLARPVPKLPALDTAGAIVGRAPL